MTVCQSFEHLLWVARSPSAPIAYQLQFAMDLMHEQLNAKAFGKLPKPSDNAHHLLAQFDIDGNGRLDLEEFYRFSLVYFSELKWPIWKVATKVSGQSGEAPVGCFRAQQHVSLELMVQIHDFID